jgi:hypothetical protein
MFNGVKNIARTRADAVIPPTIGDKSRQISEVAPRAPFALRARVICRGVRDDWMSELQVMNLPPDRYASRYPEEFRHVDHQTKTKKKAMYSIMTGLSSTVAFVRVDSAGACE